MKKYVVSKCSVEFNPQKYNAESAVYDLVDARDFLAIFDSKDEAIEFAKSQRVVTHRYSSTLAAANAVIVETLDGCEADEDYPEYGGWDILNSDFIEMDVFAEEV